MKRVLLAGVTGMILSLSTTVQANDAGKPVYDSKCAMCHAAGVANAPRLGDKAAWAPRIANGEDAMMKTVLSGKNAMPARGTCTDCSDEDLKAAVQYMVSKAR